MLMACVMQTEVEAIRDDIAPAWMQAPMSLQETAERFVRPALQKVCMLMTFMCMLMTSTCMLMTSCVC